MSECLTTDKLVEDSVNGAFREVLHELPLLELQLQKLGLSKIERKIPIHVFISRAELRIIAHLGGFDDDEDKEWDGDQPVGLSIPISLGHIRIAIQRLAPSWNATVDGDTVDLTAASLTDKK